MEVDFLIRDGRKICPIEVKSSDYPELVRSMEWTVDPGLCVVPLTCTTFHPIEPRKGWPDHPVG